MYSFIFDHMNKYHAISFIVILAGFFLLSTAASAQGIDRKMDAFVPEIKQWDEHSVIVKYKSSLSLFQETTDFASPFTARKVKKLDAGLKLAVVSDKARSMDDLKNEYEENPEVEYVEPNYIQYFQTTPNDTHFSKLWGMNNTGQVVDSVAGTADADIDAPEAWSMGTGSSAVTVAVIDSGIATEHPDLAGNLVAGYDFVNSDSTPEDLNNHGTHVAGAIGAIGNNSAGVAGVNWNAKIMPLRVFDENGSGTVANFILALDYAVSHGVKIVNYSGGGTSGGQAQYDAIAEARASGVLVVVAAGNAANNNDGITDYYPCNHNLDNIICVAATDQDDALASFSNYGAISVDVAAPGVNVYSTVPFVPFTEDFSDAVTPGFTGTQFTSSGTDNYWMTYEDLGNNAAYGDTNFYPYQSNSNGILTSNSINTSGSDIVYLQYDYLVESEFDAGCTQDYLLVQVYNGSTWIEVHRYCGAQVSGTELVDISSYKNAAMKVRFQWVTNASSNNYFGAGVDSVKILTPDAATGSYAFMDGTSMATPHVTGLAALIKSVKPTYTYSQIRSAILANGDSLASLDGTTVTGKRINAHNTLKSFDTTNPTGTIRIENGSVYTTSNFVDLNLTWSDVGYGVQYARYSNNGTAWTSWQNAASTISNWSLTSPLYGGSSTEGNKIVFVQFRDEAGNASSKKSDLIYYDHTAPSGSLSINTGASYTRAASVNLNLTASDAKSGLSAVRYSNNNRKWTSWLAYTQTKSWNLINTSTGGTTANGTKTVYVLLKDKAGNSATITDTIIYDNVQPSGTVIIEGGASRTSSYYVDLTFSGSDNIGVRYMRISSDGMHWTSWIDYATTYNSWNLSNSTFGGSLAKGTRFVYAQFRDSAGNFGATTAHDSIIIR
jgi:subtilisin family serine protease